MFRIYCSPCHGIMPKVAADRISRSGPIRLGTSDADLFRVISRGVPGSEMAKLRGPRG